MINFHHSNWKIINLFDSNLDYEIKQNARDLRVLKNTEAGYSLVELLIVILIIMIMTALAIFPFIAHRNAYRTEDQALRVMDFMEAAKMKALGERQTMRFEIDLTDNVLRVVDENTIISGDSDDVVIRQESFIEGVRLDQQPSNMVGISPNVSFNGGVINLPSAQYIPKDGVGNTVWTACFASDGSVSTIVPSSSSTSCNSPANTTIFIWQPKSGTNEAEPLQLARAITVNGGTSDIRMWQYDGITFVEW